MPKSNKQPLTFPMPTDEFKELWKTALSENTHWGVFLDQVFARFSTLPVNAENLTAYDAKWKDWDEETIRSTMSRRVHTKMTNMRSSMTKALEEAGLDPSKYTIPERPEGSSLVWGASRRKGLTGKQLLDFFNS